MKLGLLSSAMFGFGICLANGAMAAPAQPQGDYVAGKIALHFDGRGRVEVRQSDDVLVRGRYVIAGDEMTLTDESGPMACSSEQARGVYRLTMNGDTLAFTRVKDACEGRSGDLARSWTKKK